MSEFAIAVEGMHCGACVRRVKAALDKLPGVEVTAVEIGQARGQVEGTTVEAVVAAITAAGYPARAQ